MMVNPLPLKRVWLIAGDSFFLAISTSSCGRDKQGTSRKYSSSNEWYLGGNLHQATVTEWRNATQKNKLATAADWLAGTDWKGHLNSPEDFNRLKVKAQLPANAVDKVVIGTELEVPPK